MNPAAALWLLAACQPRATAPAPGCDVERPAPGELRVQALACSGQVPVGGEGRPNADVLLANRRFRVVLRHPADALTAPSVGGATVIDAAPWGVADRLHEAVPVVGGGWLDTISLVLEEDGATVTGTVRALPGRPARDEGEVRRVRYRIVPDDPWLRVEGAEGWWVHPQGDLESLPGGVLLGAPWVLAPAGGTVEDTGGALWLDGTDRLLITTDADAWRELAAAPMRLEGTAPPGRITLLSGGRVVGRLPVVGGAFDTEIDAGIDAVRLEAPGRAPGPEVAPGVGRSLLAGPAATVSLTPAWDDGHARPLRASWTFPDGRRGWTLVPATGATLGLGAGIVELTLSAGPAFEPRALQLELAEDEDRSLEVTLARRFSTDDRVLATFARPADRSKDWRGSDRTAAWSAAGDGATYATFAPRDDVSSVPTDPLGFPALRFRNGSLVQGDGFTIGAWPWNPSAREALHGALAFGGLGALDTAAAMRGGPDDARTLWVDLGWLAQAGLPALADPRPDLVALGHPGAAGDGWAAWDTWLDAGLSLVPTGPVSWVPVDDPNRVGTADVEQALSRGRVCAGTGPLLRLSVDGIAEGDRVPEPESATGDTAAPGGPRSFRIEVRVGGAAGLDHLVLVGAGGRIEARLPVPGDDADHTVAVEREVDGTWLRVQGWADDPGGDWVTTGPVWLRDPSAISARRAP